MTSNSADNGTMSLSVAFNIGTDGDINTINVNNRVQGRSLSYLKRCSPKASPLSCAPTLF